MSNKVTKPELNQCKMYIVWFVSCGRHQCQNEFILNKRYDDPVLNTVFPSTYSCKKILFNNPVISHIFLLFLYF